MLSQPMRVSRTFEDVSENHALNNCRSLQRTLPSSHRHFRSIVAANRRSNRRSEGASDCSPLLEWLSTTTERRSATTKMLFSHNAQNLSHDFPNTLSKGLKGASSCSLLEWLPRLE